MRNSVLGNNVLPPCACPVLKTTVANATVVVYHTYDKFPRASTDKHAVLSPRRQRLKNVAQTGTRREESGSSDQAHPPVTAAGAHGLDEGEELSGHHRAGHRRAGDGQPRDLLCPLRR